MLEDTEAFRARAKPQATYSSDPEKGRPLLPVVRVIEAIVQELLQWAALMPAFADRLIGTILPLHSPTLFLSPTTQPLGGG